MGGLKSIHGGSYGSCYGTWRFGGWESQIVLLRQASWVGVWGVLCFDILQLNTQGSLAFQCEQPLALHA